MIDTHAHLNFSAYKNDAEEVIKRTLADDIWLVNVGSQYSTSKRAVEIAEQYPEGVYAAIGLHPIHVKEEESKSVRSFPSSLSQSESLLFDYEKYKELAKSKKVVAIGEIGLDYWYRPKGKAKLEEFKNRQKEVFSKQIILAKNLSLPVIIHCRMAHRDLAEILDDKVDGVIHCFSGTWQEAQKYLEMGFSLGFNGIIFKLQLDEIIEKTPLDRILLETDCPYLTPPPMSGRNEPLYVKYIADKVAKIKGLSCEEISDITSKNAIKLFNLHDHI